jgi:hypothetical protein
MDNGDRESTQWSHSGALTHLMHDGRFSQTVSWTSRALFEPVTLDCNVCNYDLVFATLEASVCGRPIRRGRSTMRFEAPSYQGLACESAAARPAAA